MFPFRLALLGLLSLPFASHAQSTDATSPPRIYLGIGIYNSMYQPITGRNSVAQNLPVQLTAGYQIRPRLGVQMGVAYSGYMFKYAGADNYFIPPTDSYTYSGKHTFRNVAVSVLSRYTLTRNPEKRFQVDLLGGFTVERQMSRDIGVFTAERQGVMTRETYDRRVNDNTLLFTAGPSLRYRLSQHFDAVLDYTLNYDLSDNPSYTSKLSSTVALGVRYRFGSR